MGCYDLSIENQYLDGFILYRTFKGIINRSWIGLWASDANLLQHSNIITSL